jgi:ribosomal protein S15P/S13E
MKNLIKKIARAILRDELAEMEARVQVAESHATILDNQIIGLVSALSESRKDASQRRSITFCNIDGTHSQRRAKSRNWRHDR